MRVKLKVLNGKNRDAEINVPEGFETLTAKIATPGLVDAHSTVGFSGILNIDHDHDQLEHRRDFDQ